MSVIQLLTILIPSFLKRKIYNVLLQHHKKYIEKNRPSNLYEFHAKHLENTIVLPNRDSLLDKLTKNGIIAELGVDKGDFSAKILARCNPASLYLIDTWDTSRYGVDKFDYVTDRFKDLIIEGKASVFRINSIEAATEFSDYYFDWIYIDTDHSYETTLRELYAYKNKVKVGGYIAGHDFVKGNFHALIKYGVIEAVTEFCTKENWELAFITIENNGNSSFALKQIL